MEMSSERLNSLTSWCPAGASGGAATCTSLRTAGHCATYASQVGCSPGAHCRRSSNGGATGFDGADAQAPRANASNTHRNARSSSATEEILEQVKRPLVSIVTVYPSQRTDRDVVPVRISE